MQCNSKRIFLISMCSVSASDPNLGAIRGLYSCGAETNKCYVAIASAFRVPCIAQQKPIRNLDERRKDFR